MAVTHGLLLCGAVCRCDERGRTGDVGGDDQRATCAVHFSGIEEPAAEARFRIGMWGRYQLCVGLGYASDKIENVRRWRSERHEPILTIDGPARRIVAQATAVPELVCPEVWMTSGIFLKKTRTFHRATRGLENSGPALILGSRQLRLRTKKTNSPGLAV